MLNRAVLYFVMYYTMLCLLRCAACNAVLYCRLMCFVLSGLCCALLRTVMCCSYSYICCVILRGVLLDCDLCAGLLLFTVLCCSVLWYAGMLPCVGMCFVWSGFNGIVSCILTFVLSSFTIIAFISLLLLLSCHFWCCCATYAFLVLNCCEAF